MEPLAVWDVHEDQWRHRREEKSDWLREHGFPVDHMYRAEFYMVGAPFARVFAYHLNDKGERHWTHGHNPKTCKPGHSCGACTIAPYDVLLNELPSTDLLGASA